MVNLVTSVMQSGPQAGEHGHARQSLPVRVAKLVRDYGAVIFAGRPRADRRATVDGLGASVAFTLVNGGFLVASIAFAGRESLRG